MSDTTPTEATPTESLAFQPTVPTVTLGQPVVYIGTKGHPKAAFVVATPESMDPDTSLPDLGEGQLHLAVWTWGAGTYIPRLSVPFEALVADNGDFQEDGKTVGAWRLA